MTLQRFRLYLNLCFLFPCVQFLLFLCIPLVDPAGSQIQQLSAYLLAVGFWICMVLELLFIFRCGKERLQLEKRLQPCRREKYVYPGILSFFKNVEAIVADVVLFATIILTVIFIWVRIPYGLTSIGCMAVAFLSFQMHCLLNGKNYGYKKALYKQQKEHKRNE